MNTEERKARMLEPRLLLIAILQAAKMMVALSDMSDRAITGALSLLMMEAKKQAGFYGAGSEIESSDRFTDYIMEVLCPGEQNTGDRAIVLMIRSQIEGERMDLETREKLGMPVIRVTLKPVD